MESLQELMFFSRRLGERFDLVQAGGDNTSFKTEGKLYVKASGIRLSDIFLETHFAVLDNDKLLNKFYNTQWEKLTKKEKEQKASSIVLECNMWFLRNYIPALITLTFYAVFVTSFLFS